MTAEYRPLSPVIGQPLTVMGYCDLSPMEVAPDLVRIQLAPDGANPRHRVDLGTASLVAGHFNWSDTLKPAYGGVTIKASDSLTLFVVLPEVRTTDGRSLGSRQVELNMTPVATAGP